MACEKLELTQRNLARVRKMLFGACAEIELDLIDEKAPLGFPLDFESMDPRMEQDGSLKWSTKPKSGANCREL